MSGLASFQRGEKVFVSRERPDASGIGVCPLRSFRLQRIGTRLARCASTLVQHFQTMPLWSRIFWNSAAASLPCPAVPPTTWVLTNEPNSFTAELGLAQAKATS